MAREDAPGGPRGHGTWQSLAKRVLGGPTGKPQKKPRAVGGPSQALRAMDTRKQYGSTQRRSTPEGRGLVKEHPEA